MTCTFTIFTPISTVVAIVSSILIFFFLSKSACCYGVTFNIAETASNVIFVATVALVLTGIVFEVVAVIVFFVILIVILRIFIV